MSLALDTIKKNKKAFKTRKRLGRGNSSGDGNYSGKGMKGQRSRSGVSNLKRLGMKQVLLRTPKKRGFTSLKSKAQIVSLSAISENFKDKDTVNPKNLLEKSLIKTVKNKVKILANGTLTLKELKFESVEVSAKAGEEIKKNKGKIA